MAVDFKILSLYEPLGQFFLSVFYVPKLCF